MPRARMRAENVGADLDAAVPSSRIGPHGLISTRNEQEDQEEGGFSHGNLLQFDFRLFNYLISVASGAAGAAFGGMTKIESSTSTLCSTVSKTIWLATMSPMRVSTENGMIIPFTSW